VNAVLVSIVGDNMSEDIIRVAVADMDGRFTAAPRVPREMLIRDFVAEIKEKFVLPATTTNGKATIAYYLVDKASRRLLEDDKSFAENGIREGDSVLVGSRIEIITPPEGTTQVPKETPRIAIDWDWLIVVGLGMTAGAVLPLVLLLLRPQVPAGVTPAVYSYVLRAILVSFLLLTGGFLATMMGMHRLSQATQQRKALNSEAKACATCGSHVSPDSLFCANCGAKLAGDQESSWYGA